MPSNITEKHWSRILLLCWTLCSLWVALKNRVPHLGREFWEDEVHHNYPVLISSGFRALRANIQGQFQPILEYGIRKLFWFPVFGHQEVAMRIPSLVYSLLTLVLVLLLSYRVFLKELKPLSKPTRGVVAFFLTLPLGIWFSLHSAESYYAVEARHYTFVGLLSVLWVYLFFSRPRRDILFYSVTFLFMNSHFFSFALILPFLGWEILEEIFRKKGQVAWRVALLGALSMVTVYVNYPAWQWLLFHPPGGGGSISPWDVAKSSLELFRGMFDFFGLPLVSRFSTVGVGLIILGSLFSKSLRKRGIQLGLYLFLVIPLCFFYLRLRSAYPFGERYYMAWFGLGWWIFVLGLLIVIGVVKKVPSPKMQAFGTVAASISLLFVGAAGSRFLSVLGADVSWDPFQQKNYSSYFKIYEDIKSQGQPVLVLNSSCWTNDIPSLYLNFIGTPGRSHYEVASSNGCETDPHVAKAQLTAFLQKYPEGLIVLDQKRGQCKAPNSAQRALFRMEPSYVDSCVWKLSHSQSVSEVGQAAEIVGFKSRPGVFKD